MSTLLSKLSKNNLKLPRIEVIPPFETNEKQNDYFDFLSFRILEDNSLEYKDLNLRKIGIIFYTPCEYLNHIITTVLTFI